MTTVQKQHHKESVFSKNCPVCLVTDTIYTILGNIEIIMEAPLEGLSRAGDGVQGGMQTK